MLTVCSIRDFTSLSESMSARRTLNFLNGYLSRMQPVIEQNNGIIDKYFGDGILALWPGDPDQAVEAAMSMQRELWDYNEQLAEDPTFGAREIRIGIGIHFGRLMMGAIGAKNRIDMSVIGDTVNLASRLEGLTKFYKIDVMISESTHVRLKNPSKFNFRVLDMVRPKGKHEAIRIYECKFYSL
jgi:class 3 adenylate cyclase